MNSFDELINCKKIHGMKISFTANGGDESNIPTTINITNYHHHKQHQLPLPYIHPFKKLI